MPADSSAPIESYLTVTAFADRLSCDRRTVLAAIARGDLSAIRLTPKGHYRISLTEFQRFCDASQAPLDVHRRPRRADSAWPT